MQYLSVSYFVVYYLFGELKLLGKLGNYLREIGCVLLGFYLMAIIFAFSHAENLPFFGVLSSIAAFLSSIGVIVAMLAIIQQYHLNQSRIVSEHINLSNSFLFKLGAMVEVYGVIKKNITNYPRVESPKPIILDGVIDNWLVNIDTDSLIFLSEIESKLYVESYYAISNYNRYIESIFRWQRNQDAQTSEGNIKYLNQAIYQLEEFGSKLVIINNNLYEALKNKHTKQTFFHIAVPKNEFSDLPEYEHTKEVV